MLSSVVTHDASNLDPGVLDSLPIWCNPGSVGQESLIVDYFDLFVEKSNGLGLEVRGFNYTQTNQLQLLAMDVLVSASMKNAARCAT